MSKQTVCTLIVNLCALWCLLNIGSTISSDSIEIKLEPFDHKHCITSCEKGLREYVDRVILVGSVEIKESLEKRLIILSFQWRNDPQENFNDFNLIHLQECTGIQMDLDISCTEYSNERNVYEVYLNVTAMSEFSQAMMILSVYVGDLNLAASEHIVLPVIYKLTNSERLDRISVSLQTPSQSDFITSCENGLLANVDRLILVAKVVFSEPLRKVSITASFQRENDSIYEQFKVIGLDRCVGPEYVNDIYCTKSNSGLEYTIYRNTTARALLSQTNMLVKVFVGDLYKQSNQVVLPVIRNASEVKLILNGEQLNKNNKYLNFELDDGGFNLRLCCVSAVAPCYAIITPPHGEPIIEKNCSSYTIPQAGTYKIGYRICGVQDYKELITLKFHIRKHVHDMDAKEKEETNTLPYAVIALCVWIAIIVVACVLLVWYGNRGNNVNTVGALNNQRNTDNTSPVSWSQQDDDLTLSSVCTDTGIPIHSNSTNSRDKDFQHESESFISPRKDLRQTNDNIILESATAVPSTRKQKGKPILEAANDKKIDKQNKEEPKKSK